MLYLVTGAAGHLGNTLVKMLCEENRRVRCLVLPGEEHLADLPVQAEVVTGDVRMPATLRPFFEHAQDEDICVVHCAGVVTVASKYLPRVWSVNVKGTANVIGMCQEYHAAKLIYVSSVHALPELPKGQTIREVHAFDANRVVGQYAKTKAEATSMVLKAGRAGLNVSVVHPSGLCGPGDYGRGHLTQLLVDYMRGTLVAGVRNGGYDFVDVRDVAKGIVSCADAGKTGECYILSNHYYEIFELLDIFHRVTGRKPIRHYLPMWLAKGTARLAETYYLWRKQPPLYTPYSLYTLSSNGHFSHAKADQELGYTTRPMEETVADTADWLLRHNRI